MRSSSGASTGRAEQNGSPFIKCVAHAHKVYDTITNECFLGVMGPIKSDPKH